MGYFQLWADDYAAVMTSSLQSNLLADDAEDGDFTNDWPGDAGEYPGDPSLVTWTTPSSENGPLLEPGEAAEFAFLTTPRPPVSITGQFADATYASTGGGAARGPGPEPKVEITVVDPATGQQVPVGADGLKVAKWHDAFKLTADGKGVEIKGPDGTSNWDFIDRDRDRFNVWVYDPAAWSKMENGQPAVERVQVLISTENVAGFTAYDDAATAVDLVRYGKAFQGKTGWYWSDSQMLVSNDVDDDFKAEHTHLGLGYLREDDQDPAGFALPKNGYQWLESDRTHRIALGGTVKARYFFTPNASVADDAPVKVVKNVKLNITILRDKRAADGGTAVIPPDEVLADIRWMREIYAQVGIAIPPAFVSIKTVDPPTAPAPGVNLALPEGLNDYDAVINGIIQMEDEEKALLGATNPPNIRTPTDANGKDDIEVYFVNQLSSIAKGKAYWAAGVPDSKYADSAIIDDIHPYTTLAHEAGHVLLNDGEHFPHPAAESPLDSVNLMVVLPRSRLDGTVYDSRRLTVAQQIAMIGDPSTTPPTPAKRPNLLFDP
jgi:hypothetical protein